MHLLSTWDEGIPDDIPHENLYGISFNAMNFVKVLQGIRGCRHGQDGGHRLHDGILGQPVAEGLPVGRAHRW